MTQREQQSRATEQTPATFRLTSAFRLKSMYQRHMLYGMLVASLVVCLPTIIVAFWPVPATIQIDPVEPEGPPIGGVIEIEWKNPPRRTVPPAALPKGRRSRTGPAGPGELIRDVILVDDSVTIESGSPGLGGSGFDGPDVDYIDGDFFEQGGGGVVYVQDTNIYDIGTELDQIPVLIDMPWPEYPPLALRTETEGKVVLHLLVDLDGRVREVRVFAESNPNMPFADHAMRAALKAVFRPAIHDGGPVRCWVSIPVEFELQ